MNDLEFTDLKSALERATFILSSNDYDEEVEQIEAILEKVKKEEYV